MHLRIKHVRPYLDDKRLFAGGGLEELDQFVGIEKLGIGDGACLIGKSEQRQQQDPSYCKSDTDGLLVFHRRFHYWN